MYEYETKWILKLIISKHCVWIITPPITPFFSQACQSIEIIGSVTVSMMMYHCLKLPLPTGTQTSSYYPLDHSSEYHSGLSCPFCCITLVSVYTPLVICVICFLLHILTLSSQWFMQHLCLLFTQRKPPVIFA